jgi:alpha-glucoside transport system permease protein
MAVSEAQVGAKRAALKPAKLDRPPGAGRRGVAMVFLLPALIMLGALVVYPTVDTFAQSLQSDSDRAWVGLNNYQQIVESARIRTAIINTAIWVVIAPVLITALGLVFAVLTERVRYQTVIKTVLFMPMAISALAVGVIWRGVYDPRPEIGLANAVSESAVNVVKSGGLYPNATGPPGGRLEERDGALVSTQTVGPGEVAALGIVGIPEPAEAQPATQPEAGGNEIAVVVWRDFKPGGGTPGEVDEGELALPGAIVELTDDSGEVVASGTTDDNGVATFEAVGNGPFTPQLSRNNFRAPFTGVQWLGPREVTPLGFPHLVTLSIIFAFMWMQLGFAVVVLGSGLSALPRDVLEAARVDGASEWQVFRLVTFPLLRPVLIVIFVTLTINVLKIFDIVYVLAPVSVQDEANVIALEMWKSAFAAREFGVGAAVAVLLFILVIPIMIFNLRRFKREEA